MKIVLFEGINLSGKTTLIKQFKERYPKQIEVIKFPRNPIIVNNIVYLYKKISQTKELIDIYQHLEIIHQLFDLDFRQFSMKLDMKDQSKVYFLDRYYPSNIVYAGLHKLKQHWFWLRNHEIIPNMAIFLHVTDEMKYLKEFPVYDNSVEIEFTNPNNNKIKLSTQLLTPEILFGVGQSNYIMLLNKLFEKKLMEKVEIVTALQENTFRNVERILMREQIL